MTWLQPDHPASAAQPMNAKLAVQRFAAPLRTTPRNVSLTIATIPLRRAKNRAGP